MRVVLQPAYVLHTRPYRDTSLLVEAFTAEHGRMGLVAKGARAARSRWRGVIQPFKPLLLSWSGRGELVTLTGAEFHEPRVLPLAGRALLSGLYLNELLYYSLQRYDPHRVLFDAYHRAVTALAEGEGEEPVLRVFEKHLLRELGYGLVLDVDAAGGRLLEPERLYDYQPERGPVPLDGARASGVAIHGASLAALEREVFPDARSLREVKQLMRTVLAHHLGGRVLKSRELFGPAGKGSG